MNVEYRCFEGSCHDIVDLFNDLIRMGICFDILHLEYSVKGGFWMCLYVVYGDEDDS